MVLIGTPTTLVESWNVFETMEKSIEGLPEETRTELFATSSSPAIGSRRRDSRGRRRRSLGDTLTAGRSAWKARRVQRVGRNLRGIGGRFCMHHAILRTMRPQSAIIDRR